MCSARVLNAALDGVTKQDCGTATAAQPHPAANQIDQTAMAATHTVCTHMISTNNYVPYT